MTEPRLIDTVHLGTRGAIGAWVVDDSVLVDPGPAVALPGLLEGLGDWRPDAIAVTHIHLDHAGATGALLRRWPGAEVWVHELGAPHLADPARLVRSARRVYGSALDTLWGAPEPVPAEAIRALSGGECAGPFEVIHTPGHATHHVSYMHPASGTAFVGDVAGVRIPPARAVLAPAVPPDFDPPRWLESLARIEAWRPACLALTHFGRHADVTCQLDSVRRELADLLAAESVRDHVAAVLDRDGVPPELERVYEQAAQPDTFAAGVRRYLETQPGHLSED
jgi:glyoxylase-like metal-dependent hydrolase (beta-lactamase superfamily II)